MRSDAAEEDFSFARGALSARFIARWVPVRGGRMLGDLSQARCAVLRGPRIAWSASDPMPIGREFSGRGIQDTRIRWQCWH